ncbi:MAG: DUF5615 family PIN-like protein [Dehalococcoidia bacterium]
MLADESVNRRIVSGLRRRKADIDLVRAQDVGLIGASDPAVLDWAATNQRIVVTQDVNTLPGYAFGRVRAGLPMPGVLVVPQAMPIGQMIEGLLFLVERSLDGEWEGQILHLPLR